MGEIWGHSNINMRGFEKMFEQGLRSLVYQIKNKKKNTFRFPHGAFKTACLMSTAGAHAALSV